MYFNKLLSAFVLTCLEIHTLKSAVLRFIGLIVHLLCYNLSSRYKMPFML